MSDTIEARPDMIGGIPTPPLAILPEPSSLFARRAQRFERLAETSNLSPYLTFLSALSRVQAKLARELEAGAAPDAAGLMAPSVSGMPPLDRQMLANKPGVEATLDALIEAASDIDMPAEARLALDIVRDATSKDRRWLTSNIMKDEIPLDSVAPHLFVAAAVQVHMAWLASLLDTAGLVPIRTGVCPCCGGKPGSSIITEIMGSEGARYASCACCQSLWNEVRVKCLTCSATKGISYQSVDDGSGDAQIKAECCDECGAWTKQLVQSKNPAIDPIADDVASLGLDWLMKDTAWQKAAFNPFTVGY